MASIIDNRNKTMLDSLKNSLKQAESVDILTAFFYFSGFNALAEDLKDKKIRILVGNTIDPEAISDLCRAVKDGVDDSLETYAVRGYSRLNNSQKKNCYIDSFVSMFNKSALSDEFDSTDSQAVFKMFLAKIADGSLEIRLTGTLKMLLINNIVGSDTRTLTPDETLQSYFRKQYEEADAESNDKSWDVEFRNVFNNVKHNVDILDKIRQIPERARIVRKGQKEEVAISFAKRGNNSLFALADSEALVAKIVPPELVLKLFQAPIEEKGFEFDKSLDKKFAILRDEIRKPYPKIKLDKRKSEAIVNLQQLLAVCPTEKDYISDLLEVIKSYDDLSDGELKYLASLNIRKSALSEIILDLKQRIPVHYIIQIKTRVESIDAQTEVIMFTEDLRNDIEN